MATACCLVWTLLVVVPVPDYVKLMAQQVLAGFCYVGPIRLVF